MFALSDATIAGVFAVLVAFVSAVGVVSAALLTRSTRIAATDAKDGVDVLARELEKAFKRVADIEAREEDCLDALEWSYARIGALEDAAGITSSPAPEGLQRRRSRR